MLISFRNFNDKKHKLKENLPGLHSLALGLNNWPGGADAEDFMATTALAPPAVEPAAGGSPEVS